MSRLVRLDRTGHTELAQFHREDNESVARAQAALDAELERGYFAVATGADGVTTQVRELALDADLVILRLPIAGG